MNKNENLSDLISSINNDDSNKVKITAANFNDACNWGCDPYPPSCKPGPPGPPGPQGEAGPAGA